MSVVIEREFDAPIERVWRAWTDPDELARWWGSPGSEWAGATLELKPGGKFHYATRMPNGTTMWGLFVYREIEAPTRLVYLNAFSDEAGGYTRNPWIENWPLTVLNTLTLEARGPKTLLRLHAEPYEATDEECAVFEASLKGMAQGFEGAFTRLDADLAKR